MAEPERADPRADLGTNQVCQDFFHWSFFQSPEGQAGVPEPAVPCGRATGAAHLLHQGPQTPSKTREEAQAGRQQLPRLI